MDVHDIWQENKRWILGVGLGYVVWFVADSVIGSMFASGPARVAAGKSADALRTNEYYGSPAFQAAQAEQETFQKEHDRLVSALVFEPPEEFRLEGKGTPDVLFYEVGRSVKKRLLEAADNANVDWTERGIAWPTPNETDEYRAALVGLALLDEAGKRLLEAHRSVVRARPEALGLVAVEFFRVEPSAAARPGRRGLEEPVVEHRVAFKFTADSETTERFLESCRSKNPPISLAPELTIDSGKLPGEPLRVSGKLVAVQLRQP